MATLERRTSTWKAHTPAEESYDLVIAYSKKPARVDWKVSGNYGLTSPERASIPLTRGLLELAERGGTSLSGSGNLVGRAASFEEAERLVGEVFPGLEFRMWRDELEYVVPGVWGDPEGRVVLSRHFFPSYDPRSTWPVHWIAHGRCPITDAEREQGREESQTAEGSAKSLPQAMQYAEHALMTFRGMREFLKKLREEGT